MARTDNVLVYHSEASASGRTLSLQRLEGLLGERAFMQMLSGQHSYLTAAIKSLPLRDSDADAAVAVPLEERELAQALRQQCLDALEGMLPVACMCQFNCLQQAANKEGVALQAAERL